MTTLRRVSTAEPAPERERRPSRRRRRAHEASAAEIRATARRVLAEQGLPGLTVSAVARELDVVPSALYRYVGGRDDLLAAVLGAAYEDLAETVERAGASTDDPVDAMVAAARAWRRWALGAPAEFALVFGPASAGLTDGAVGEIAVRVARVFAGLTAVLYAPGRTSPGVVPPDGSLADELAGLAAEYGLPADAEAGAVFLTGWLRIESHLAAEVFGQLTMVSAERREDLFAHVLTGLLVDGGVDVRRARAATARPDVPVDGPATDAPG